MNRRAVLITGFGNGKSAGDGVAEALAAQYDFSDVQGHTFSWAMEHPHQLRRAVRDADVFTHSAGMMALTGTSPRSIEAFAAPLPTTPERLIGRTVLKTLRMHTPGIGIQSRADLKAVGTYNLSTLGELGSHAVANLGRLADIAAFNAVQAGIAAVKSDIPTTLTYHRGDEYFTLTDELAAEATAAQLENLRVNVLPKGIHDELIIRPAATLAAAQAGDYV